MAQKPITTLLVRDEEFYIVKHEESGMYCAINTKYIDERGRLTKGLNGLDMCASKTVAQCVDSMRCRVEVRYRMDNGMSMEQAFKEVFKQGTV